MTNPNEMFSLIYDAHECFGETALLLDADLLIIIKRAVKARGQRNIEEVIDYAADAYRREEGRDMFGFLFSLNGEDGMDDVMTSLYKFIDTLIEWDEEGSMVQPEYMRKTHLQVTNADMQCVIEKFLPHFGSDVFMIEADVLGCAWVAYSRLMDEVMASDPEVDHCIHCLADKAVSFIVVSMDKAHERQGGFDGGMVNWIDAPSISTQVERLRRGMYDMFDEEFM